MLYPKPAHTTRAYASARTVEIKRGQQHYTLFEKISYLTIDGERDFGRREGAGRACVQEVLGPQTTQSCKNAKKCKIQEKNIFNIQHRTCRAVAIRSGGQYGVLFTATQITRDGSDSRSFCTAPAGEGNASGGNAGPFYGPQPVDSRHK